MERIGGTRLLGTTIAGDWKDDRAKTKSVRARVPTLIRSTGCAGGMPATSPEARATHRAFGEATR
jgi:hypothetical protein